MLRMDYINKQAFHARHKLIACSYAGRLCNTLTLSCTTWEKGSMLYANIEGPDITKTHQFEFIKNFTTKKGKFSDKSKSDSFHISAENIDCGTR